MNQSALKTWAYSLHMCSKLAKAIEDMSDFDKGDKMIHKEEMPYRINGDKEDRKKLKEKIEYSINVFQMDDDDDYDDDAKNQNQDLINIVTGKIASKSVNVDSSIAIGERQACEFEASWPDGFYEPISKKIVVMSDGSNHITANQKPVFDTALIYSRILCLQTVRNVDLPDVFKYELAPVPTSLFEDNGDMRITKSKSTLKRQLQITSKKIVHTPDVMIIDGCAMFWVISYPLKGTVGDFVKNVVTHIVKLLQTCEVHLIFDRYYADSIKAFTRQTRASKLLADSTAFHSVLLSPLRRFF